MAKTSKAALEALLPVLAENLANILKNGVPIVDKEGNVHIAPAPAAFFKEARELLKDNNIQALDVPGSPMHKLAHGLPFGQEDIDQMNASDPLH